MTWIKKLQKFAHQRQMVATTHGDLAAFNKTNYVVTSNITLRMHIQKSIVQLLYLPYSPEPPGPTIYEQTFNY